MGSSAEHPVCGEYGPQRFSSGRQPCAGRLGQSGSCDGGFASERDRYDHRAFEGSASAARGDRCGAAGDWQDFEDLPWTRFRSAEDVRGEYRGQQQLDQYVS